MSEEGQPLAEYLESERSDNPEQRMIDQENFELFLKKVRQSLSKMECEVLDDYLSGLNYQQIAEKMKKSPKAIDNALQRIKTKSGFFRMIRCLLEKVFWWHNFKIETEYVQYAQK